MAITGAFILPHPPIILPEVGRGEEKKIDSTAKACKEIARRIAKLKPETIVLSSPHCVMYADYFHISPSGRARGDMRRFGASASVEAQYDTEFIEQITVEAQKSGIPAGTLGAQGSSLDHGTLIPLRFIDEVYTGYRLVRIGLSGLSSLEHYSLGKCVARAAGSLGRNTVYIASGDLSHKLLADGPYGYSEEGPQFDEQVTRAMESGNFLSFMTVDEALAEAAAECGLRSFQLMAGALDGRSVMPELLSYEGPFGVGYAVAAFTPGAPDEKRRFDIEYRKLLANAIEKIRAGEDPYVRLARLSLESYVKKGKIPQIPDGLPDELLNAQAGVFVSIKKRGGLRGCIGTIEPVRSNIAEEIMRNAVSAGCEDPRFEAVTPDELDELVYSVDVLGKPEEVSSRIDLDAKRYGVIVTNHHRRGLLLPNLDGVDTVDQQLDIARRKAGIRPEEPVALERFEVVRHK